jgi:hypothetical protein
MFLSSAYIPSSSTLHQNYFNFIGFSSGFFLILKFYLSFYLRFSIFIFPFVHLPPTVWQDGYILMIPKRIVQFLNV